MKENEFNKFMIEKSFLREKVKLFDKQNTEVVNLYENKITELKQVNDEQCSMITKFK